MVRCGMVWLARVAGWWGAVGLCGLGVAIGLVVGGLGCRCRGRV